MTMDKYSNIKLGLAELFEVDASQLTDNFPLDPAKWDSLAIVTFVSLVHMELHIVLPGHEVAGKKNLGEVWSVLDSKQAK